MIPKYRAWDIEFEKMVQVNTLFLDKQTLKVAYENGGVAKDDINYYVLMQSTGLKDKNGKEIFEGDLITETGVFNSTVKYGSWIYEEDFGAKAKSVGFYLDKSYEDHTWYENFNYDYISKNCEVVGNIYENKNMIGYGDNNE